MDVAGGSSHSLGLKADGTLWAWGLNDNYQLGNGTNVSSLVPIQISNCTLEIDTATKHSIGLYPNPVATELNISNVADLKVIKMTVLDVMGKVISVQLDSFSSINVSSLQTGIYFLQMETATGIIVEKFIKK